MSEYYGSQKKRKTRYQFFEDFENSNSSSKSDELNNTNIRNDKETMNKNQFEDETECNKQLKEGRKHNSSYNEPDAEYSDSMIFDENKIVLDHQNEHYTNKICGEAESSFKNYKNYERSHRESKNKRDENKDNRPELFDKMDEKVGKESNKISRSKKTHRSSDRHHKDSSSFNNKTENDYGTPNIISSTDKQCSRSRQGHNKPHHKEKSCSRSRNKDSSNNNCTSKKPEIRNKINVWEDTYHGHSELFRTPFENQVKKFHEAIVKMIAEDLLPVSIVENSGFRNIIQLLDFRYEIPSSRVLGRTIIPRIHSTVRSHVQTLLNEANHVAITTDVWMSMNTDSYLTITVHFLCKFQLKTLVLCTMQLEQNHTGNYLCEIITEELNKWNIFDKVVAVVTDGEANIKSAVGLMNLPHLPCTAHKLNLIVQQALQLSDHDDIGPDDNTDESDLKKIFKKCRNIVDFFKRSEEGNRMLVEKQKQLGNETVLNLKQDVCTQWNSTFLMLERLIQLQEPLTIVMITLKEAPSNLDSNEWSIIEDIVPLLRLFDKLTVELSAEHYPTISTVIPLIRGLQCSLVSKTSKTFLGNFIKKELLDNITKQFDGIEEQALTPHFSRATLLDPRCKKLAFEIEQNANEAERCLVSETVALMRHLSPNTDRHKPYTKTDSDNIWNFLQSRVTNVRSQTTTTSSATSLMRQYLSMPHQDLKCNVALFWNEYKSVLAPLSDIALKYAIIPATSVPAERIFSKAGQILRARRNRLLPQNVDVLIFLNKNMDI